MAVGGGAGVYRLLGGSSLLGHWGAEGPGGASESDWGCGSRCCCICCIICCWTQLSVDARLPAMDAAAARACTHKHLLIQPAWRCWGAVSSGQIGRAGMPCMMMESYSS